MRSLAPSSPPFTRGKPSFTRPLLDFSPVLSLDLRGTGWVDIRETDASDREDMIRFQEEISDRSVHRRYFEHLGMDRPAVHWHMVGICGNTPESYAVVMERRSTPEQQGAILSVGRLNTTSEPLVASFDTLITRENETPRLGKIVLHRLIKVARVFGFRKLTGEFLIADPDGFCTCWELGFAMETIPGEGLVRVSLQL